MPNVGMSLTKALEVLGTFEYSGIQEWIKRQPAEMDYYEALDVVQRACATAVRKEKENS